MPAWDAPDRDVDAMVDKLMDRAIELGRGGLAALGATTHKYRLSDPYRYSVRAASRAVNAHDQHRCRLARAPAVAAEWNEGDARDMPAGRRAEHD